MTPSVTHIDHIVLTVRNIPTTVAFYESLGMKAEMFYLPKALQEPP